MMWLRNTVVRHIQGPSSTPRTALKDENAHLATDRFQKSEPSGTRALALSLQASGSKAAGWEEPDSAPLPLPPLSPPSPSLLRLPASDCPVSLLLVLQARGRKPRRNSFQSQMWCQGSLSKTTETKAKTIPAGHEDTRL